MDGSFGRGCPRVLLETYNANTAALARRKHVARKQRAHSFFNQKGFETLGMPDVAPIRLHISRHYG